MNLLPDIYVPNPRTVIFTIDPRPIFAEATIPPLAF